MLRPARLVHPAVLTGLWAILAGCGAGAGLRLAALKIRPQGCGKPLLGLDLPRRTGRGLRARFRIAF